MLLDTSGLFRFHHSPAVQHADAVRLFPAAPTLLTHNYVPAEFVALADSRHLPRRPALDFVADLQDNPAVEVIYVDEARHRVALAFLQRRLDKEWSLCDAVSFVLMTERGELEALTTDHHFEQAGFIRLLRP